MEDNKKIIIKNKCIKACEVGKWKCVWGVEKKMGKQLRPINDQNGKLIKMLKRCKLVKWWSDRSDSLATSNRAQGQNGLGQEAFVTSLMAFLAFIHNEKSSSSSSGGWCFRVDSSLCIFWGIEGEESGWIWERERERVRWRERPDFVCPHLSWGLSVQALFQISKQKEWRKKNRQEAEREREKDGSTSFFDWEKDLWLFDVRCRRVRYQGTLWEEKVHQSALIGQIYLVSGRTKPKEGDLLKIMRDRDGQSVSNKARVSKNTQKQQSSLSLLPLYISILPHPCPHRHHHCMLLEVNKGITIVLANTSDRF